ACPARQPTEIEHVGFDGVGAQRHGLALDQQQGIRLAQFLAQRQQRLAEAVARLLVAAVAPQQGRQPVARLLLPGMAGEIGEEGLRLPCGESHIPSIGPANAEAPQQSQLDDRSHQPNSTSSVGALNTPFHSRIPQKTSRLTQKMWNIRHISCLTVWELCVSDLYLSCIAAAFWPRFDYPLTRSGAPSDCGPLWLHAMGQASQ